MPRRDVQQAHHLALLAPRHMDARLQSRQQGLRIRQRRTEHSPHYMALAEEMIECGGGSLLLTQSGHFTAESQCPLLGVSGHHMDVHQCPFP
jgi:hypothetical protein